MSNIFKNWKTTSAGILMMVSAIVVIVFPQEATKIVGACTGVLGGLGLIFAGDGSASIQSGDTVSTTTTPTPHVVTKVDPTTSK